jgi:hypothetical protein
MGRLKCDYIKQVMTLSNDYIKEFSLQKPKSFQYLQDVRTRCEPSRDSEESDLRPAEVADGTRTLQRLPEGPQRPSLANPRTFARRILQGMSPTVLNGNSQNF